MKLGEVGSKSHQKLYQVIYLVNKDGFFRGGRAGEDGALVVGVLDVDGADHGGPTDRFAFVLNLKIELNKFARSNSQFSTQLTCFNQ